MSQENTRAHGLLLIEGMEISKEVAPTGEFETGRDGKKWMRQKVVPNSLKLIFTLAGDQEIVVKGDGLLSLFPLFDEILDASKALQLDPSKDSVTIEAPGIDRPT
jgi:hypothetical protein